MANHLMYLEKEYPSGAQRWGCSQCPYLFVVQWQPEFKRIILAEGKADVTHRSAMELEALTLASGEAPQEPDFPDDLKDQINDVLGGLE